MRHAGYPQIYRKSQKFLIPVKGAESDAIYLYDIYTENINVSKL